MAGLKYDECIGASYHLSDTKGACARSINCYPQKLGGDRWMMASAPGLESHFALGEVRGSKALDDRWFVVGGDKLYEAGTDGVFVHRGTLGTTGGYVGIAINQSQVVLVDGPNLYVYNYLTQVFAQVASAGWRGSDDVHELDGYFVFVDPGTDQFYISAIDDGTSLDALDFSSADSSPDAILTHRVNHRQLWLFGKSNSTEIWVNTGNAAFPFGRYQAYTLDLGIVGKRAAINAADTLFFVGKTDRGTGIVYMVQGNQPARISNIAVEQAIRNSSDIAGISMWTYQDEGHEFVGLEIPGSETTWVFDAALGEWHERGFWDDGWQRLDWKFVTFYAVENEHFDFEATHFVGHGVYTYILKDDEYVYDWESAPVVRERTWPHIVKDSMEPVSYRGLELSMQTGELDPDGNPGIVTLEISNDGGATFGPPLQRSLGATGRRMERIRWLNLGTATNRVFRIRCSSAVPFSIYGAAVDT